MENNVLIALIFISIIVLFLYFLPSIIARNKKDVLSIFLLNLFLGATGVGWVIALVWACKKETEPTIIYVEKNEQPALNPAVDKSTFVQEDLTTEIIEPKRKWDVFTVVVTIILVVLIGFILYNKFSKNTDASEPIANIDTTSNSTSSDNLPNEKRSTKTARFDVKTILDIKNASQLYEHYGEKNLRKEKFYDNENNDIGYKYILYPNTSKEVEVNFSDGSPSIIITKNSKIKLPYGIYVGMPLEKLLKINREHITFKGFEWDYDGYVVSFNNGVLQGKDIALKLVPSEGYSNEVYSNFIGDKDFKTSDEGIELLNLRIGKINVF
ncbi:superinfection immunity protein [Pedobacter helvus]|uniref:Superinfection immunity protein n=1 Tax=Pedobacter helvus TaxID=2563444 RepID=A0ABW9JHT7_9SPHI|nr:superinfection immunity protein [Pedobacter ureilyticus]